MAIEFQKNGLSFFIITPFALIYVLANIYKNKMSEYNRAETIKVFVEKIASGQMEISELRKTFENQGLETDEINIVVGQVDKRAMRTAQMKEVNANGKNLFYGGLILAAAGLILTIGTFSGLIDLKGYGIIAYGPIAAGLITAMIGKSQMNRK